MSFSHSFHSDISSIGKARWQACFSGSQPFLSFDLLALLEDSDCLGAEAGWQVCHLLVEDKTEPTEAQTVACIPLYIKSHSYGEYLFDWSWADAYEQHGIAYYPKIVSAVPFTPVTGQRIGIAAEYLERQQEIYTYVSALISALAKQIEAQTAQLLFLSESEKHLLTDLKWLPRSDVQYHWFNRDYQTFDDFLAALNARKRKSITKERNAVASHQITIKVVEASEVTPQQWQAFYNCYRATYAKRSGHGGYLSEAFFHGLSQAVPTQCFLVLAESDENIVAGSLFFADDKQLYGRYWGALANFNFLHFELCYYQGIELCLAKGLQQFNAGAQGQHKIKRGFEPVYVHGSYQIFHPSFRAAINDFLGQESVHNKAHFDAAMNALPYRKEG